MENDNLNKDWYKNVSLKSGSKTDINWWSPEPGEYEVTFSNEPGNQYEITFDNGDKKRTLQKVPVEIVIGEEEFTWGVTISSGETSVYGQLVKLAHKNKGIKDVKTKILVQGIKKERRYTIPEVVGYVIEGDLPSEQ